MKGKVLRIFDTKAVFENLDTGNCLLVIQTKDSGNRHYEKFNRAHSPPDLGSTSQVLPFDAIFGFYDLLGGSYVALVVESESYVDMKQINIRKAKKILVVPLFRNGRLLSDTKQSDEDRYLQLLHLSFADHNFFFSFTTDVTLTQQSLARFQPKQLADPAWTRADNRFFWNHDLILDLITNEAEEWIVPFMSAYVELRPDCTVEDITFSMLFISRRSRYRQGYRFIKRGLDDNGHAANFVETEQILLFKDGRITSYVQIRGSIPVQWCSPVHMRYDPIVYIDENKAKSAQMAERHIQDILNQYSDPSTGKSGCVFINLVDNKKDQGRLGVAFKEVIDAVSPKVQHPLNYIWFDFHHECKQKGKWNNLSKLVLKADALFQGQKYFSKLANGQVTSWQCGVIRTNCMDNLDRTNVVQSLFARRSLILQVGKATAVDMNGAGALATPWKNFEKLFKTMWVNNANSMSLSYSGTGALKVDFTKTGKRTFQGIFNDGCNSVMRYYMQNFTDGVKQDGLDLLLGIYHPDPMAPSPFTARTSEQTLSSNITKAFVLLVMTFSTLMLFLPPSIAIIGGGAEGTAAAAADAGKPTVTNVAFNVTCENALAAGTSFERLELNMKHLRSHLMISVGITSLVVAYMAYRIVKKGSKIGEKMVVRPELSPEPLPAPLQQQK